MPALLTAPLPPTVPADSDPSAHNGQRALRSRTSGTDGADVPDNRGRAWLEQLFAGTFPFPAVAAAPLPPGERSAAEHDAGSRAAGCRDLFIVHADPFAGERLIADLARATTERVLILSPNPAAADRITDRLLKCGAPVLRALADDENPTRPSPSVSKVTSAALGASRGEQAKREAAAAVAAAEKRLEAFAAVSKAVARLREVNALIQKLDADVVEHTARRDRIEAEVADEVADRHASAFTEVMARCKIEHDALLGNLIERRDAARTAAHDKEADVKALRAQHTSATQKSGFFGRLFSKPKSAAEADEIKRQLQAAESELAVLTAEVAARQTEMETRAAAQSAERQTLIADEVAARRTAFEATLTASDAERTRARAEVAALNKVIAAAVPGDDHAAAEENLTAARTRAAEVARSAQEALSRAVTEPRIVVGTPGCLGSDPVFGALTALVEGPPFGLLVLDRAEELPEPEFPRLARFAARWVLVGDALPPEPRPAPGAGGRSARNARPVEAPFVARIAKLLDRETWAIEGDRLVCRLTHLTPEQRRTTIREPLADRPEIELRFTDAEGDGDPLLAEIAFPGATAVPEAKRFLFRTLSEVLLRPCGEVVWKNEPDALTATWPAANTGRNAVWIDLEQGVREQVTGTGLFAYTAAVRFDTGAGWDAERAAAWLDKHLPALATGRFAALPRTSGPRTA
jgi:hypothetical protein